MKASLIFILLFAIMVAVFSVQNIAQVTVTLLLWKVEVSLVIVILVAVTLGAVMVFLIDLGKRIGVIKERRELSNQIERLTEENRRLQRAADTTATTKDGEEKTDDAGDGEQAQ